MRHVVGNKYETKRCGVVEIIEVLGKGNFIIQFEDGYRKTTTDRSLLDGKIKNLNYRSVYGIGILGEGYKCTIDGVMTKEYSHWIGMMSRCYNDKQIEYNPSYSNKFVRGDWHYFQTFAEWCQDQRGFGLPEWQLDKDLLFESNLEYSAETCVFLPRTINSALAKTLNPDTVGVHKNSVHGRYQVGYYNTNTKLRNTKTFLVETEAVNFYNEVKFDKLKIYLAEYKDLLDTKAISRLNDIINNI